MSWCHRCGHHKFLIAGVVESLRRAIGRISSNPNSPKLREHAVELKAKLTAHRADFEAHKAEHEESP